MLVEFIPANKNIIHKTINWIIYLFANLSLMKYFIAKNVNGVFIVINGSFTVFMVNNTVILKIVVLCEAQMVWN